MAWEPDGGGYFLIPYTAAGVEIGSADGLASDQAVERVAHEPVTDVVVMSHGWNGDVPAARRQYKDWLDAMGAAASSRDAVLARRPEFQPLVVGLHWPSKAWGDEDLGGTSFGVEDIDAPVAPLTIDSLVTEYAARLVDTDAVRGALRTIFESALDDIAPDSLPQAVQDAYAVVDSETSGADRGPGGPPGDDREAFDARRVYARAMDDEGAVDFGRGRLGGLLAPLRTLTFWNMKRLACTFGESGAAQLVRRLQTAVPSGRSVRFHLVGHSFGCIVVSACVAGPSREEATKVHSVSLIQGALSLWSYCASIPAVPDTPGYFNRLVADELVDGAMVATMSEHDRAVGFFYPLGAGVAKQVSYDDVSFPKYGGVGSFGVRGPMVTTDNQTMHAVEEPYDFHRGVVYNLEASGVISVGDGPSGAHSDICHPEVAHAVWSAIGSAP
jgi:hypothetical protein